MRELSFGRVARGVVVDEAISVCEFAFLDEKFTPLEEYAIV
ncbi:hypothetical protein N9139_00940 [Akkermansiaceae bacterium]|nr:hypothetical protein [Akkermansiaceae bacterium]